ADWVYFEEVFDRNYKAYWWSPDSTQIAFLRFDDHPVHKYTVVDHIPVRQKLEQTPYPKLGDPNPQVKIGVASVKGESPRFADLTPGNWEVTTGAFQPPAIKAVDEEGGWVYFTGKRDSPIADDLYRARLDGSTLERLTKASGDHTITVSPKGTLFVDSWGSHR